MNILDFAKGVERLVDPMEVGKVLYMQTKMRHLHAGFVPAKAAVFESGPEKYYGIVTMFRIHTSVFWGARTEFIDMSRLVVPDTGEWFGWDDGGAWVGTGNTLAGAVVLVMMRRR